MSSSINCACHRLQCTSYRGKELAPSVHDEGVFNGESISNPTSDVDIRFRYCSLEECEECWSTFIVARPLDPVTLLIR